MVSSVRSLVGKAVLPAIGTGSNLSHVMSTCVFFPSVVFRLMLDLGV